MALRRVSRCLAPAQVGEEDYRWPELQRQMREFSPSLFAPLWQARRTRLRVSRPSRPTTVFARALASPAHPLAQCTSHAQVFNVTFICLYQHLLLLLIALPAYVAQRSSAPLGPLDAAAAALFLAFLALESAADQQQWVFQQSKRGLLPRRCARAVAWLSRAGAPASPPSSRAPARARAAAGRSWRTTTSAAS